MIFIDARISVRIVMKLNGEQNFVENFIDKVKETNRFKTIAFQSFSSDVFDEKTMYLKSLQHYLINLPLSLHHVLQAIHQEQPQINKRQVFIEKIFNLKIENRRDFLFFD